MRSEAANRAAVVWSLEIRQPLANSPDVAGELLRWGSPTGDDFALGAFHDSAYAA